MWLEGATNMADSSDLGWESATPGKTYVVGISPCFFFRSGGGVGVQIWCGEGMTCGG